MRPGAALPALCALLALTGCGDYVPYVRADRSSLTYRADVAACQRLGAKEADRRAKAKGALFMTYPVSFPLMERNAIDQCMHARGYADAG